jgi:hypothetical protein
MTNYKYEPYHSYQNRSHDDTQAGLDLALIEMAMFGKKLPVKERAQMFLYFENERMRGLLSGGDKRIYLREPW